MNTEDYYDVLGIGRNATQLDIENAYEYFKTLNKNDQIHASQWEKVQEAYKILSDPKNRMLYDEVLKQQDTAPGASFSPLNSVPVIDQSSAANPTSNTGSSLAVGIAAAVVIFLAVLGVVVAFLADENGTDQPAAIVADQVTERPRPTITLTPSRTPNAPREVATLSAEFADWQRCQVTNMSPNPVTIYDEMDDTSGLPIFLMMEHPIEIYRDSSASDWYLINPDQIVTTDTITGSTGEAMPQGNFLRAEDVQVDVCFGD